MKKLVKKIVPFLMPIVFAFFSSLCFASAFNCIATSWVEGFFDHSTIYIIICILSLLLAGLFIFPFCKAFKRIKNGKARILYLLSGILISFVFFILFCRPANDVVLWIVNMFNK